MRWTVIGILGRLILWLWGKSSRFRVAGEEEYLKLRAQGKPVILLIWHGRILHGPYFFRRRGLMTMISPSRDGEIPARIIAKWGYRVIRGSSSHPVIQAWKAMKRQLGAGGEVIIVADGPKGPARNLKAGCIKLAQETGAAIVPFALAASRKKFLKSWDRFMISFPLARVLAVFGTPISITPSLMPGELDAERKRVEREMVGIEERADAHFDRKCREKTLGNLTF